MLLGPWGRPHTVGKGAHPYNMKLSDNRAGGAKQWLVSNAGVQASRIKTSGWGEHGRQKMTRRSQRSPKIILGIPLAIGVIVFIIGLLQCLAQFVNIHLPTVQARVTKSRVASIEKTSSATSYQPEVVFHFMVRGKEYEAKTFATTNSTGYPEAKRLSDSYSPGSEHLIHYNPADMGEIYSNAGYTLDFFRLPIILLTIGAFFIGVFLWFAIPRTRAIRLDEILVWTLLGWGFALLGVVLVLAAGWSGYTTARILKTWPTVDAQVTNSRVHRYVTHGGRSHSDITYFEVIAEYRYPAATQEYVSPSSKDYTSSKEANQALALYAPGSRHEIRYNPGDPNEIFNQDSNSFLGCYILSGIGTVLVAFGVAFLLVSRLKRNQATASHP
jgi:hypothetical protein